VVLDGQGADEIFAGYPRHQVAYLAQRASRGAYGDVAISAVAMAMRDRGFARDLWRGSVVPRARRAIHGSRQGAIDFLRPPHDRARAPAASVSLEETLRRDILSGNLRAVLALTDRNSMAHSIEARVPYVHRPLVEFAMGLPDAFRVGAGQRKRLLRALGERYLPREVAARRDRIGFGAPNREWLRSAFGPELRALADGPTFRDSAGFDRERLRGFVEAFLSGRHRDAGAIWRLYAVDQWARAHSVTGI
jgi:asparagine synthase (glutamine-hydrolysing)